MKTRLLPTILLLFLFHSIGISQLSDDRLRENCLNDANYWQEIMGLTDSETKKLSNILYTYESSVNNLPKDISNYRVKLEEIGLKKKNDLSSLFGNSRLKSYTLITKSSEDFTSEMLFDIKNSMQLDSAFIREVSMQIRSRYPILIRYHQELMNRISKEDYSKLEGLKMSMFHKLDSLNKQNINIIDTIASKKEIPLETKTNILVISTIIQKYEDEYESIYIPLSDHQQRWDKEMEQIILNYYPESNLNTLKEYEMFFRTTGINKELDKFLLYMLDPKDEKRYFQSLMIIQKIEEQIFLIHK